MTYLETKYLNMLSPRLERFRKVDEKSSNFRCPLCGDSQKNKFKARAYVYEGSGRLFYRCFNCGASKTFTSFLEHMDPTLYAEYKLEYLKDRGVSFKRRSSEPIVEKVRKKEDELRDLLRGLVPVSKLSSDDPVKKYLASRKIPEAVYEKLYYCKRFMEWTNTILPGKFSESQLKRDEPRLVIPFIDEDGSVFAVTGRSFKKSSIKYITIKFDEGRDKIFGMDTVDPKSRVYVVEGPIDSYFLDNSIAFAGSSGNVPKFDDSVIILDNEPRNRDIVRLNERFIDDGRNVCIWPNGLPFKDLNEMFVAGMSRRDIKDIIDKNTVHGLAAKVKLGQWKRT